MNGNARCRTIFNQALKSRPEYAVITEMMQKFSLGIYKDVNPLENFRVLVKDCGVSMKRLNSLNIIHVAGTKGKGSTCAFIESILRHHNYKTGFYSSPHIRCKNDRVRINNKPIQVETYLRHLRFTNDRIKTPLPSVGSRNIQQHTRAAIMTMVAILAFLEEKVDVAIMETILGGRYDDTNVATKPVVCGITQIDLDHCKFLGNDISSIAWFKAGIMKENVPVFVQNQSNEVLNVFKSNAKGGNSPFAIAPELESYTANEDIKLGLSGNFQRPNASLSLQICRTWMSRMGSGPNANIRTSTGNDSDPFHLSPQYLRGLSMCTWPCRAQTLKKDNITFFLDGAHTPISCQHAADWYKQASSQLNFKPAKRILMFASKSGKDASINFRSFEDIQFDEIVLFVGVLTNEILYSKRLKNMEILFESLQSKNPCTLSFFKSFAEAYAYVEDACSGNDEEISIFVTGSLSLCADVLRCVEPSLSSHCHVLNVGSNL